MATCLQLSSEANEIVDQRMNEFDEQFFVKC